MRKLMIALIGGILIMSPILYIVAKDNDYPFLDWFALVVLWGMCAGLFAMLATFANSVKQENEED